MSAYSAVRASFCALLPIIINKMNTCGGITVHAPLALISILFHCRYVMNSQVLYMLITIHILPLTILLDIIIAHLQENLMPYEHMIFV